MGIRTDDIKEKIQMNYTNNFVLGMQMRTDACYMSSDVPFTMFPIINMTQNCLNGGIGRTGKI